MAMKSEEEIRKKIDELQNEPLSSLTHLIGAILSIAGLVILVVFAAIRSTAWQITGFSIFGASLILLYLASALYHFFPITHRAKNVFRRIDHSMIYVLIAGTYTPICFVLSSKPWGWTLFGLIWGLAIIGIVLKAVGLKINRWLAVFMYILMGWLIIIAFPVLLKTIPATGILWLITGGIFYTLGTIFFGLDKLLPRTRWFGMHEIFHLFVIGGSVSHFWLMFKYILYL